MLLQIPCRMLNLQDYEKTIEWLWSEHFKTIFHVFFHSNCSAADNVWQEFSYEPCSTALLSREQSAASSSIGREKKLLRWHQWIQWLFNHHLRLVLVGLKKTYKQRLNPSQLCSDSSHHLSTLQMFAHPQSQTPAATFLFQLLLWTQRGNSKSRQQQFSNLFGADCQRLASCQDQTAAAKWRSYSAVAVLFRAFEGFMRLSAELMFFTGFYDLEGKKKWNESHNQVHKLHHRLLRFLPRFNCTNVLSSMWAKLLTAGP